MQLGLPDVANEASVSAYEFRISGAVFKYYGAGIVLNSSYLNRQYTNMNAVDLQCSQDAKNVCMHSGDFFFYNITHST